jgi:hypothetical protein
MQILDVEVAQDHIDALSRAKKPILGIAGMIWNSVDADATDVKIQVNRNALNSIDSIKVLDNGLGITMADAQAGFGHLGGSWKKLERQSKRDGRILHGKQGQGRAFALCEKAEWRSVFTDLRKMLEATKDQMRRHFLQRDAEKASGIVERWKEEEVYPFHGEAKDVIEETERQIFDVVASSLDSYVSEFKEVKSKAKKLTFNLLRYALESNPSALQFILTEVVGLPKDKQDEFAALLQKTSLISMINASRIVTDRLDFLKGLEYLIFDPEMRPTVKVRSQLHKLVARNTWIFGDEFFLVNNDESLETVLRKHVKDVLFDVDLDPPVLRPDGTQGVVDIGLSNIPPDEQIVESDVMISKVLKPNPSERRYHLVIELKRPSQKVTSAVIGQTRSYALAIAEDERFQNVRTNWIFWALSTSMDKYAQLEAQQQGCRRASSIRARPRPSVTTT